MIFNQIYSCQPLSNEYNNKYDNKAANNYQLEHNMLLFILSLQWRHNERDTVSDHQPHDCLHNRLFICISKKTSKLRVTCLCAGNSPVTGEFPAQMASNEEFFFHLMTSSWCIHVLYGSSSPRQRAWLAFAILWISTFDEKKWYITFVMKGVPNICYSTQLQIPWKYSPIHFQQYQPTIMPLCYRHRMHLKQISHDKNRDNCNSLGNCFYVNICNADTIDVGLINLVHNLFVFLGGFFPIILKTSSEI